MSQLGDFRPHIAVEDVTIEAEIARGVAQAYKSRQKLGATPGVLT